MQTAATRTGPPPDPFDDVADKFPTASAERDAFVRFAGHLPALRLPPPRPGDFLKPTVRATGLPGPTLAPVGASASRGQHRLGRPAHHHAIFSSRRVRRRTPALSMGTGPEKIGIVWTAPGGVDPHQPGPAG